VRFEELWKGRTEFDSIKLPDVLRKKHIHLLFESAKGGFVIRQPIRNDIVVVTRIDEFEDAAHKVPEVFEQQIVVGADERIPGKLAIACLGPN